MLKEYVIKGDNGLKKKNKALLIFLCIALAALIPFLFVAASLAFLPDAYGDSTFLSELADKYALLNSTEEKKIVLLGGSSVAFGFDSETVEKATGYKVVNFGLYATLGTKMMLDLSESALNEGDIVVLAPELDPQTMSLYFNATSAWQALEKDYSMLPKLHSDCYDELVGGLFRHLVEKYDVAFGKKDPTEQNGVYSHSSFNAYGDISYERPYNTMKREYDPTQTIVLSSSIVDAEFVDYVNAYIKKAEKRGASVVFSFCPMNSSAMDPATSETSVAAFTDYIRENIHCEIISDARDSILAQGYFFDTNYHLNDAGVQVHTQSVTNDLLRYLGREDEQISADLPEPPGRKPTGSSAVSSSAGK